MATRSAENKNLKVFGVRTFEEHKNIIKTYCRAWAEMLKEKGEKEPDFKNKKINEIMEWLTQQKVKTPKGKRGVASMFGFEVQMKPIFENGIPGLSTKMKSSDETCLNHSSLHVYVYAEAVIRAWKENLDIENKVIATLLSEAGFRASTIEISFVAVREISGEKMAYTQLEKDLEQKIMDTQQKVIDFIKAAGTVLGREEMEDFKWKLIDLINENDKAVEKLRDYQKWLEKGDEKEQELYKEWRSLSNLNNEHRDFAKKRYLEYRKARLSKLVSIIDSNKVVEEIKQVENKKEESKIEEVIEENKGFENVVVEAPVEENKVEEEEKVDERKKDEEDFEKAEADKKIAGEAIMEKIRLEVIKDFEKPVEESKKLDEVKIEEEAIIEKLKLLKDLRNEIDKQIESLQSKFEEIKGLKAPAAEKVKVEEAVKEERIEKIKHFENVLENMVEKNKDLENIVQIKKDDENKVIEKIKDLSRQCDYQMYLFMKWSSRKSKCPLRREKNMVKAKAAWEKNQMLNAQIKSLEKSSGLKVDI